MKPKTTATAPSKLDSHAQRVWLLQHIPHRVCAVLAWLRIEGDWAMPPSPKLERGDFHVWCIGRSVDEGRKVAMRWLIEFVGVAMDFKTRRPTRPKKYDEHEYVWINRFDRGELFDLSHPDAVTLAEIWKGCTQASMHPTTDTGHRRVDPSDLAEALTIIIAHLEKHLYAPNKLSLLDVVHDQEERKRFPLAQSF